MAVDQQAVAESRAGLLDQFLQRPVIGPVEGVDALGRIGEAELVLVDFLAVGDHPGDGAKPGGDPGGVGIDVGRQRVLEHLRVELERLPVGVEIGAGEERAQERRAVLGRGGEDFVDESVFQMAKRPPIQA